MIDYRYSKEEIQGHQRALEMDTWHGKSFTVFSKIDYACK